MTTHAATAGVSAVSVYDMVAEGSFRHDLFARLAGFRVTVPPLAERRTDLGVLIGLLHARIFPVEHPGFDIDAARLLLRYPWPLNVRELERCLQAAVVLAGEGAVELRHLPPAVAASLAEDAAPAGAGVPEGLAEPDRRRREELVAALRQSGGNVTAAARVLGKARVQLQRWIKRYRIDRGEFHR